MLNKIIATLITVGGMGYVNYSVATQLNAIDIHRDAKVQAIAYSTLWSIVDFAIYLAILNWNWLKQYVKGDWLLIVAMLSTIVISFFVSVFLMLPLKKFVLWFYNKALKLDNHSSIATGSVWNHVMDPNNNLLMVYLYDFEHNPLGFGFVDEASDDEVTNYSLSLQPFNYNDPKLQDDYDSLQKKIQDNEFSQQYTIRQFVDFNQQFIAITLQKE